MAKERLIKTNVEKIPYPTKGQVYYYDTELPGFTLCVGKTTKTYLVTKKVEGKTKRIYIGRHPTVPTPKARIKAEKILAEISLGERSDSKETVKQITLRKAFEDMLYHRNIKPNTEKDYRQVVNFHVEDWLDIPLISISDIMVRERHRSLEDKKATADKLFRVLRAVWNFAIYEYLDSRGQPLITRNAIKALSHARAWYRVPRRTTLIRNADYPAWYKGVMGLPNKHQRDYIRFIWLTGMRLTEAASIKWDAVDLDDKTVVISKTKNGDPLKLPLSDFLHEMLLDRRAQHYDSPYLFPSPQSKTGHIVEPRFAADLVVKSTGIKFTIHDLRRGFVTAADNLSLNSYQIKRLINHKMNGDVTAGYIIPSPEPLREPMQQITNYFLDLAKIR